MATAADVIAYARAATDHDVDQQVTDPQLIVLLNPIWQRVRRQLGQRIPVLFTKVVTFTLTGATQDLTASPVSLTDFERVRRLRRLVDSTSQRYEPVGAANPIDPELLPPDANYAFLVRGTTLELFPAGSATGSSLELSYNTKATKLTGGGTPAGTSDVLDAPDGIEEVLGEELAAKIRPRFDEEASPHVQAAATALRELLWDLTLRYGVHPEGLREEARS